jgi:hypothetical protein
MNVARRPWAWGPALALVWASPTARGDARAARELWDAAAQAYEAAQYLVAAEAFVKAYEALPSPALLFSAAQAYRREFFAERRPEHLREALRLYRAYLGLVSSGGRREEATDALGDLARFEIAPGGVAEGAAAPNAATTRLLISSNVRGAVVRVDGAPARASPLVVPVDAGDHEVVVQATGHFEERRRVLALRGELVGANVELRPMPAWVAIRSESDGVGVFLDGARVAATPLERPLAVPAGRHSIALATGGRVSYATVMTLEKGSTTEIDAELPPTRQRWASIGLLATGAGGLTAAALLAAFALDRESDARVILERRNDGGNISVADRDDYERASAARDDLRIAAFVTGGAGAALLATGIALFVLDDPVLPASGSSARLDVGPGRIQLGGRF